MKKRRMFVFVFLCFVLLLSSCSRSSKKVEVTSTPEITPSNRLVISNNDELGTVRVVEETQYYKVIRDGFFYYYYIYNKNHEVVKSDGPNNKQPKFSMVNYNLVKYTIQAGTGIGTLWGYYYDVENNMFSEVFECIYDQYDNKVAYGTLGKVIVRDIFDVNEFYQEISTFRDPFAKSYMPIQNATFNEDGSTIKVFYLTGSDFKQVEEIFEVK